MTAQGAGRPGRRGRTSIVIAAVRARIGSERAVPATAVLSDPLSAASDQKPDEHGRARLEMMILALTVGLVLTAIGATAMVNRGITLYGSPNCMTVSPDGRRIYVGVTYESGSTGIDVIDTSSSNSYSNSLNVEGLPTYGCKLSVSPDGQTVYAATGGGIAFVNFDTNDYNDRVAVVPIVSNGAIEISPDGQYVFATNNIDNRLEVVSTSSRTAIGSIPLGGGRYASYYDIAVSFDSSRVYVLSTSYYGDESVVEVLDPANRTVIEEISLDRRAYNLLMDPAGRQLYVPVSDQTWIIDTGSDTVSSAPDAFTNLLGLSSDGRFAFTTSAAGIQVFDVETAVIVARAPFPVGAEGGLVITPDGRRAYGAHPSYGVVSSIDLVAG